MHQNYGERENQAAINYHQADQEWSHIRSGTADWFLQTREWA